MVEVIVPSVIHAGLVHNNFCALQVQYLLCVFAVVTTANAVNASNCQVLQAQHAAVGFD